jgi:hypothetical protein
VFLDVDWAVGYFITATHKLELPFLRAARLIDVGERLKLARGMTTTPDALEEILSIQKEELGRSIASHFPRLFEYPWVLDQILKLKIVASVADIGAGVSPLPVALAKRGVDVYTFDANKRTRTWTDVFEGTKSGWGFLDYGQRYEKIRSFNEYFDANLVPGVKYDVIYSVSVVEHTPKRARVAIWDEASKTLSKDGRLVFSIDIEPNSNNIWNRERGVRVEEPEVHGKISDIHNELREAGFVIETQEILRGIPMSLVDILFFAARRV